MAIQYRDKEAVGLLLEKGADPERKDEYGQKMLLEATKKGSEGIVDMLLQRGVDVKVGDNLGRTALSLAVNLCIVQLLPDRGAGLETKDHVGRTLLQNATKSSKWSNLYHEGQNGVVALLLFAVY
ncbi:hypothetical protein ACHAO1_006963 [Botrytis cinerea]